MRLKSFAGKNLNIIPRVAFVAAAFVVKEFQQQYSVPFWALLIAAVPGLVAMNTVMDWTLGRLRGWLDVEAPE